MFAKDKITQSMIDAVNSIIGEESKLDEPIQLDEEKSKSGYDLYHKSYSDALSHAHETLKSRGYHIHDDNWFHHVSVGPKKPAEGKTNSLNIPLHKDGQPTKKHVHIQVYNRGNTAKHPFELNMYHEDVQLENKGNGPQETFTDNNPECGVDPKKKLKKESLEVSKSSNTDEVTTDMIRGRVKGGKINSFKSFKLQLKTDGEMKAPSETEPTVSTAARSSITPKENGVTIKPSQIVTKEEVKRSDIPAWLRKKRGDTPLTPGEVKAPSKDSISHSKNLEKSRNEEVEPLNEDGVLDMYLKSRGLNPELVPRDKKVAYAKSPEFQKFKSAHQGSGGKYVKIESVELDESEIMEAKMHPLDAHRILDQNGGRGVNFFSLKPHHVEGLLDAAKEAKYRKSKSAPGSTARMFHQHLNRLADKHVDTEGNLKEEAQIDEGKKSPTLGTKLIKKYGEGDHTAEVRHDAQWNDYQVHHYHKGVHKGEGPVSYHYDDKEDAHNTAKHETDRLNKMKTEEAKTPMDHVEEKSKKTLKKIRETLLGKSTN